MKRQDECMPVIDDSPMTKERMEKMYQRWVTRKSDKDPLYKEDYEDGPTGGMKVHA